MPPAPTSLIDYLTQPATQIATARAMGFFPVVKVALPADLDPGVKLAATAIAADRKPRRTLCRRCCRSVSARMAANSTR